MNWIPTEILAGKSAGFRFAYRAFWVFLAMPILGFVGHFSGILFMTVASGTGETWIHAAARFSQGSLALGFGLGLVGLLGMVGCLWFHARGVAATVVRPNWVAVAAMAGNRVIGKDGRLPWHLPEDFKHFKNTTMGGVLLMGRKTWESIGEKPLPGREAWVLSRNLEPVEGATVLDSVDAALRIDTEKKVFVIGGAEVFAQAIPYCAEVVLTEVRGDYDGDVFLPAFEEQFQRKEFVRDTAEFAIYRFAR